MAKLRVRQPDGTVAEINLGKFAGGSSEACVVDQTYNSESENAQSGKAVAEAIEAALDNAPSGGGSFDSTEVNAYIDEKFADLQENGISVIKTTDGKTLRFFVGTKDEYEALENKDGLFAIISDDTTKEDLFQRLQELENGVGINEGGIQALGSRLEELYGIHMGDMPVLLEFHENLVNGKQFVAKAEHATQADSALFATEAEFCGRVDKAYKAMEVESEPFTTQTGYGGFCYHALQENSLYIVRGGGYGTMVFVLFTNTSEDANTMKSYSSVWEDDSGKTYRLFYNAKDSEIGLQSKNANGVFAYEQAVCRLQFSKIASTIGG